ncbi:hypothetical protein IJ182_08980 [bacterium]|nr:hypothetical protein [bacterium]
MKKFFFIITLMIFCCGMCCINALPDNDIWARLIVGAHIVENFSILKNDFLSYTPTHPWYDHEWGASIFIYSALKYFGDSGLILLKGILSAITIFICYKTVEIREPKNSNAYNLLYFVIMYLAMQNSIGNVVRCLMFTCVFFSLFLYILEKTRHTGNKKLLILLPVIMVFWSNIHGGCISGLGLIAIYCFGEFLNKKSFKEYIYTGFGTIVALFINPYGFEYVKFLFYAATMDRSTIAEWLSSFHPKFVYSYLKYKFYLIFMTLILFIDIIKQKINYEKADKTKILLYIVMAYLSITHVRHQLFFVITAGVFLYDEFYGLFNTFIYKIRKFLKIENPELINNFCMVKDIIIYAIILLITLPPLLTKEKTIRITETAYPRYAIEFIKINNITGNLFINFDWGSYAAYKLYPNNLIVMDGRYEEVYNPNLLDELYNFHLLENDWYKIIRDYKTDVMVLEKKYPVYEKIVNHPEWTLVFENNLSGVFVPSENLKEKYLYPTPNDDYYNQTKFDTGIRF